MKNLLLARLAIGAAIAYQLLLVVIIFLRPDLPVYSTTISEWAIGHYGWLMQLAFFISAMSYLFLYATLKREVKGRTGKIALTLLFICFLGTFGVGIFTTNPYPPDLRIPKTLIHTCCGTLAMVLYPVAILLLALNISRGNEAWAGYRSILKAIGFLPLLGFLAFIVHLNLYVIPLGKGAVGPNVPLGYPPRVMFLAYHMSLIAISALFLKTQTKNVIKWQPHKSLLKKANRSFS
jgi:hypothetical protein